MSSSTVVSPEKEVLEDAETNGLRGRGNLISRRDYNNPNGGAASDAEYYPVCCQGGEPLTLAYEIDEKID